MSKVWAYGLLGAVALSACTTTSSQEEIVTANVSTSVTAVESTELIQIAETSNVKTEDERRICKSTTVIGSKFKKRVCATESEWAVLRERTEHGTEYLRQNIRSQSGQSGS